LSASRPEAIARLARLMDPFPKTWFLIGGWAVDAWLGEQSREHQDVDIGLFRGSETSVFEHLRGWHMAAHDTPDAAHDDEWDGRRLRFPAHIHARRTGWPELDLNFNERAAGRWILNRDPRLTVVIRDAIRPSAWGVPLLAPELVLWHKGRSDIRPRDANDFVALLPLLDSAQREWLAGSVELLDERHPWLPDLAAG
jgi:hypothetical protein